VKLLVDIIKISETGHERYRGVVAQHKERVLSNHNNTNKQASKPDKITAIETDPLWLSVTGNQVRSARVTEPT